MVLCIFALRVVASSKKENLRGNQLVSSEIDHRCRLFRYCFLRGWPRRDVHAAHLPHVEAVATTCTSLPSVHSWHGTRSRLRGVPQLGPRLVRGQRHSLHQIQGAGDRSIPPTSDGSRHCPSPSRNSHDVCIFEHRHGVLQQTNVKTLLPVISNIRVLRTTPALCTSPLRNALSGNICKPVITSWFCSSTYPSVQLVSTWYLPCWSIETYLNKTKTFSKLFREAKQPYMFNISEPVHTIVAGSNCIIYQWFTGYIRESGILNPQTKPWNPANT